VRSGRQCPDPGVAGVQLTRMKCGRFLSAPSGSATGENAVVFFGKPATAAEPKCAWDWWDAPTRRRVLFARSGTDQTVGATHARRNGPEAAVLERER
jgi:hypothetical protein